MEGNKAGISWELTGAQLKWVALLTMVVDHIGVALLPYGSAVYWAARMTGRISFPLYCFLLVEGFCHTGNLKRYMGRLAVFALISEIPFNMMNRGFWYPECQNVFFTLFIGLMALAGYVRLQNQDRPMGAILWCGGMAVLAWLIGADYDWTGVLLICFLYRFRQDPLKRFIFGYSTLVLGMSPVELPAILSFGLMGLYGGKRGQNRGKWAFYWMYPVHLLILGVFRMI